MLLNFIDFLTNGDTSIVLTARVVCDPGSITVQLTKASDTAVAMVRLFRYRNAARAIVERVDAPHVAAEHVHALMPAHFLILEDARPELTPWRGRRRIIH